MSQIQRASVFQKLSVVPRSACTPPEGADPEPVDAADVASSGGLSWGSALALGALASTTVLMSACLPPEAEVGQHLPEKSQAQDDREALHFELIPNGVGKIDLIRQTRQETGGKDGRTVKADLRETGVYLGHGLFLDDALNLSFVPDRLVHEPIVPQDFLQLQVHNPASPVDECITQVGIQTRLQHPGQRDRTYTRESNSSLTVREIGRLNDATVEIRRDGNKITILPTSDGVPQASRIEIRQEGNTTRIHGPGLSSDILLERSGDQVFIRDGALGAHPRVDYHGDGSVDVVDQQQFRTRETIRRGSGGLSREEHSLVVGSSTIVRQGDTIVSNSSASRRPTTITVLAP